MDIPLLVALAEVVAAFAATLTILYAVREFRYRKRDELDARVAELLGVSLTYKLWKPRESEVQDGSGIFTYEFTVHNPGRLPISQVSVWINYPGAVRRIHSDDARTEDPEGSHYEMYVASVAARSHFMWKRRLKVPCELWKRMRETEAEIWFSAPDVGQFKTTWPRGAERPQPALHRRLDQLDLRASHESRPQRPQDSP